MGQIYLVKNKINGKSYIGQTSYLMKDRKVSHERSLYKKSKMILQIMQSFIWEDDWKSAYLSFKKCPPNFHEDLKGCFRGQPEKKTQAIKLYKEAMKSMIDWLQHQFEIRDKIE